MEFILRIQGVKKATITTDVFPCKGDKIDFQDDGNGSHNLKVTTISNVIRNNVLIVEIDTTYA